MVGVSVCMVGIWVVMARNRLELWLVLACIWSDLGLYECCMLVMKNKLFSQKICNTERY